jgi:hypothetical protein
MLSINKRVFVGLLSLALLFAIVSPASAQWRRRDRGLSTGEKAGIIAGSTAAGAVIGGLLGGKTGAIIGGGVGAAGGTGVVVYKDRQADERWDRYRDSRWYRDRYYRDRSYDYNRSYNRWRR